MEPLRNVPWVLEDPDAPLLCSCGKPALTMNDEGDVLCARSARFVAEMQVAAGLFPDYHSRGLCSQDCDCIETGLRELVGP